MGARGRKSSAELATTPTLIETRRPAPPADLGETEAAIWRDTIGTMPLGWIVKAQYPILSAYCRHTARATALAKQVEAFEMDWLKEEGGLQRLDKLLAMAERESRALTACARAMRLTHQAMILPRSAGRRMAGSPRGPLPWDGSNYLVDHSRSDPMFDDYEGDEAGGQG